MQGWEGNSGIADYESGGAVFDYDQFGYAADTNADFTALFSTALPAARVPSLAWPGIALLSLALAIIAQTAKRSQRRGE